MLLRGPEAPFHLLLHLRVGVPEGRKLRKRTAEGQPAGDPERLLDMGVDLSAQLLRTLRRRTQHEERLIRRQVQRFHVQLQDAAQALIKYEGIVLQKIAVKIHKNHGPKPLQLVKDSRLRLRVVKVSRNGKLKRVLKQEGPPLIPLPARRRLLVQLSDQPLQTAFQILRDHRLQDIVYHTERQRGTRVFKIGIAAENKKLHLRKQLLRLPDQLQPVHPGHLHVREQDVRPARFLQLFQRLQPVSRLRYLQGKPGFRDQEAHTFSFRLFIVYHQNAIHVLFSSGTLYTVSIE